MLTQLVKLLDGDLHQHLKQEVSICTKSLFTIHKPACLCSHDPLPLSLYRESIFYNLDSAG